MININLLPEVMRKKERMPLPQLLGMLGVIVVFCLLGYMIVNYMMNIIPNLENRKTSAESTRQRLQVQANRLKEINAEIAKLTEYVDAVKTLYRQRIVWSKVLSDLKHIVNFDPAMSEYNQDMRYLWLTKLSGKGSDLTLNGYATAANQVVAIQMPERLLQGFLTYAPLTLPEKDEEARLQDSLKEAQAEHDALRRDNPDLPLQGPKELAVRQRLEEIQNIKSGGIAMKPFSSLFEPSSLRLINATWTNAPARARRGGVGEELFPTQAWQFGISMKLK